MKLPDNVARAFANLRTTGDGRAIAAWVQEELRKADKAARQAEGLQAVGRAQGLAQLWADLDEILNPAPPKNSGMPQR